MVRTGNRPKPTSNLAGHMRSGATAGARFVWRHPVLIGGTTAFAVTLAFVAANAVWYQPHAHRNPLFQTRSMDGYVTPPQPADAMAVPATRIVIERAEPPSPRAPTPPTAPAATGDPTVARVQDILADLKLYEGTVDGLTGPQTRQAVESYQRIVGLQPDGIISAALLEQLQGRNVQAAPGAVPVPGPAPRTGSRDGTGEPAQVASTETTASVPPRGSDIERIQAGLRAFGNDQIVIDGVLGAQTRKAILEFQSLFGLTETGLADAELAAKMREIGLIR